MASPQEQNVVPTPSTSAVRRWAWTLYRLLASLELAVVLIVVLAAVLAWATFMEAGQGREYTQWFVYSSQWFIALLALLGVNVLAAALIRFPWERRQIGFVVTHAGILVLLAGAIQTFIGGVEGQLNFVEGETNDSLLLTHRSSLKLIEEGREPAELVFSPGPVDWPDGTPLDFGIVGGVGVKVLKFYRHARHETGWTADELGTGPPAVRLCLFGPNGESLGETWCESSPFGVRAVNGMPSFRLQQAATESMVKDFLEPPAMESGSKGVLSVHYQGKAHAIPVDENEGKEVPIGNDGFAVKIVEYFANAISKPGGGFESKGDLPDNPMLRIDVKLPNKETPIPEIAYAKNPFVNRALMRGVKSPVDCWFHNPDCPIPDGVEFLQAPSGKLFCRVGAGGKFDYRGEVTEGDRFQVSAAVSVLIDKIILHAREDARFYPVELAAGETTGPEAAVLVELSVKGKTHQFWLQRNSPRFAARRIGDPQSPLFVSFSYDRLPLGFSLRLIDFERGLNPGRMGNASFKSQVQLIDKHLAVDRETVISMNEPLVHDVFTFYQSGFEELPDGRESSSLSVSYDPGRFLKYLGSAMICGGLFAMFYLKRLFAA